MTIQRKHLVSMRFLLLIIGVVLLGACAMPPAATQIAELPSSPTQTAGLPPSPTVAPTASPGAATTGWERHQDVETGWSFALPPGSRVARETEERPWYTLITPAVDFSDGNVVSFGADNHAMADDLSLAEWVAMRETVGGRRIIPLIASQWVMLDEDRADPQGLLLETHSVGLPGYTFYRVYGDLVIMLSGPATPEMASFLPQFASTIQLTHAALAKAREMPSLPAAYQAAMATLQAMQAATPALDIVARDATAAAQLTPRPQGTYSPDMQTQEAVYYRSLETATAVALLTTPTPTSTSLPTATPIPAGRPGYALYQGRGVYYETPRLQVEYDMSQWSLLALDYFDQAHLVNRQWPDCVLRLQGGPRMMFGPAVVEWITLDEQQWTRTDWRGDHTFIYYPSPADDPSMNFMIELRYGAAASREEVVACRSAAEQVLATMRVLD